MAGVGLVLIGGLVALAGAYSYLNARRELATSTYRPQVWLHLTVVAMVVVGAVLIAVYLISTP